MAPAASARRAARRRRAPRNGEVRDGLAVGLELRQQRLGERHERTVAGGGHDGRPPLGPGRQQSGPEERALAGAGRPDQAEQARPPELAPHGLHLDLAAEEVRGVLLAERGESGIGSRVLGAHRTQRHLLESAREREGALVTLLPIGGNGTPDHARPGRLRDLAGGRRRFPPIPAARAASEATPPGVDHLRQHHARPRRRRHGRRRSRRGPARAACRAVCRRPSRAHRAHPVRDPEVHHHHPPGAGEHDVLGLEVPMDEARLVDRRQAGQELGGDLLRLADRRAGPRSRSTSASVRPVDVLHADQLAPFDLDEVEHAAHIGRRHLRGPSALRAGGARAARGPAEVLAHRLQGHVDPQLQVVAAPDLAHAAAAEEGADAVAVPQHPPGARRSSRAARRVRPPDARLSRFDRREGQFEEAGRTQSRLQRPVGERRGAARALRGDGGRASRQGRPPRRSSRHGPDGPSDRPEQVAHFVVDLVGSRPPSRRSAPGAARPSWRRSRWTAA